METYLFIGGKGMSNRIQISIYSHDGNYIDSLFDSDKEFEGQAFAPQVTINSNGQKDLSLSIPLRILSKDKSKYIDNPRWEFITKQYKICEKYTKLPPIPIASGSNTLTKFDIPILK